MTVPEAAVLDIGDVLFAGAPERHHCSGHLGGTGAGAEIYRLLEADMGVAPERLLFTDHRSENVAAAVSRGWRSHRFDGAAGWGDRVVAEAVPEAEDAVS